MILPTAEQSYAMARHLGRALGCNVIPCDVETRAALVKWARWHSPGSPRVTEDEFREWAAMAASRERRGVRTAWQVLPGSGRLVALDVDDAAQIDRLQELHGETPLVVRSPTPGHAHLWYRWPVGVDLGCVSQESLPGYAVKARGGAIHAPGSVHKAGVGFYRASLPPREWTADLPARLPHLDLAALDADRVARLDFDAYGNVPESWADETEADRRARAWLEQAEHVVGGREGKTFHAAMTLGDFGVRLELAERLIVAWDARAPQPRGATDTCETVRRAYASRRLPPGCRRVAHGADIDADALLADLAPGALAAAAVGWSLP